LVSLGDNCRIIQTTRANFLTPGVSYFTDSRRTIYSARFYRISSFVEGILFRGNYLQNNLGICFRLSQISPAMINATPKQLRRAAKIKERIDVLQDKLSVLLGGDFPSSAAGRGPGRPRKRKMSAAGRAAIAAAARARWARYRGGNPSAKRARNGARKMSAAGRRALSLAAKARWAKAKAAGKSTL
jgi:hypothetical protein